MSRRARRIVKIDEEKCDGCGACVPSCAEGAVQVIDGKARLVAENLCDGLGNCLGTCPKGAITIEERPAEAFDEAAVEAHKHSPGGTAARPRPSSPAPPAPCGEQPGVCPGAMARTFDDEDEPSAHTTPPGAATTAGARKSRLRHWPVQLTLLPTQGPMWDGADVLLAADCTAFAMPDFHERLLAGKTLAVACPKLDDAEAYVEKMATVFSQNAIRSVTVARMEVPCCGGLEQIVGKAMERAGKRIPVTTVVLSARGEVLEVRGAEVGGGG